MEKSAGGELSDMGEGIFKSALPLEKYFLMHFCCICGVLKAHKIWLGRAEKVFLLLSVFHASMILWGCVSCTCIRKNLIF